MFKIIKNIFSVRPEMDDHVISVLGETRLFENLSLLDIEKIAEKIEIREYNRGEIIFSEGDRGDGLYIIDKGLVEVLVKSEIGLKRIALIRDREHFGEMALIDEAGLRTASVKAMKDTTVLYLSRDEFEDLLASSHITAAKILYHLSRTLSRRLARTSRIAADVKNIEEEGLREDFKYSETAPALLPPPPPISK